MKRFFCFVVSLVISTVILSQDLSWARDFNGVSTVQSFGVTTDNNGNVFTTGYFQGTVDFDPGPGTSNLVAMPGRAIFVSKLDIHGNFVWAKKIDGRYHDWGNSIACDTSGNVLITGFFDDTVDFDPGIGVSQMISSGFSDIFILKLDNVGNFMWSKKIGGTTIDAGVSICSDLRGNVYTTGKFSLMADFNPGAGVHNMTAVGGDDIFILKLDNAGNFVWAKQFGGSANSVGNSIYVDTSGNVFTTGFFYGTTDFNPNAGTYNLSAISGSATFISKLDSFGNFVWAKTIGGSNSGGGQSIVVSNTGDIYVNGSFMGTHDFNPGAGVYNLTSSGNQDIFIMKLNAVGNFVWAHRFGNTTNDQGLGISTDNAGNIYSTGYFSGSVDFDPGSGTHNLSSTGGADVFVLNLDPSGALNWAVKVGNNGPEHGKAICNDFTGSILVTGYFYYTVDFNFKSPINNLTSAGSSDAFVMKILKSSFVMYDTACYSYTTPKGKVVTTSSIVRDTLIASWGGDSIVDIHIMIYDSTSSVQTLTRCNGLISPSGKLWTMNGTYYDTIPNSKGCDSLMTFHLTVTTGVVINNPILTGCDSIQHKGIWYKASQNVYDTIPSITASCDTIIIDSLNIKQSSHSILTLNICDSLISGSGRVYTFSGLFYDTMPNSVGCDSTIEYYLTVNYSTTINNLVNACDSVLGPNGAMLTTSGTYRDTIPTSSGCDSIINTYLIIDTPTFGTLDTTICYGDSLILNNGMIAKSTGTFYDTIPGTIGNNIIYYENFNGPTHSFTLNTSDTNAITPNNVDNAWIVNNNYIGGTVLGVLVRPTPNQNPLITGSVNSRYLHVYSKYGASFSFPSIRNCNYVDASLLLLGGQNGLIFSKMTNDISTVGKSTVSFELYYLCKGSYGRLYYSLNSGVTWNRFGGNLNNGGAGWSTINIVDPVFANQSTIRFAVGFNNINGPGREPGFAVDEIKVKGIGQSSSHCDSNLTINLTVLPLNDTTVYDTICSNSNYTLPNGVIVNTTGVYSNTLTGANGCDSIVNTNLYVRQISIVNVSDTACDSLISVTGKKYIVSGTYIDTFSNSVGCDSLIILNLIVYNSKVVNQSITVCDSLILPSGTTVYSSGIYNDTGLTISGCDSIVSINLTIATNTFSTISPTSCDSYSSPSGKAYFTSGMYADTISNSLGCDSVISINLTILTSSSRNLSVSGCDSYTLPGGGTVSSSGIYSDTLTGVNGCDSIIVTNLVLGYSSTTNQTFNRCIGETIIVGSNVYGTSGTYRDTFLTTLNCDSIIVTVLTINPLVPSSITYSKDLCLEDNPEIFIAIPIGGVWSGSGINPLTGLFDPVVAGAGITKIYYEGPSTCATLDSINVEVFLSPDITFVEEDDECDGGIGLIDITVLGGAPPFHFTWSNSDTTEDIFNLKSGNYWISVIDNNSCEVDENFSIVNLNSDTCDYHIYLPNIFSPDGNGENDVFFVEGIGIQSLEFFIYNRWGNVVFKSRKKERGWNGNIKGVKADPGVYIYMVSGTFQDGQPFEQKGTVTLVR